ncbi:GNAT family N-acetyltransferase [Ectobacillus ponti]|uniref:GNAT family N-acetyltransferase n=1 Tax=Ectobacillus ponti TaxID=2961894 RepID=A0AA41X5B7_9BACI|nr:GNAT family N-acetyltransferase [Ectobacillus ponti]
MNIRTAVLADLSGILEIYNDAILHTAATLDLQPQTLAERANWFRRYNDTYPLIVAEEDGKILGYCSLSPFREKEAYKQTVEISVYVHPEARGKGLARRLIDRILELGRGAEHHVVIAGITRGNDTSVRLHESYGFTYVGCFQEVGYKFDAWQDVLFYQLIL